MPVENEQIVRARLARKSQLFIAQPWPRLQREKTAASYVDYSPSWMRNTRYADRERIARGEPPRGPKYIRQGKSIRYPIEYLDEWVDQLKKGKVSGWEVKESDTSGLKHQGGGEK